MSKPNRERLSLQEFCLAIDAISDRSTEEFVQTQHRLLTLRPR